MPMFTRSPREFSGYIWLKTKIVFSYFPGSNTFCVIADKITIKVNNVISKGVYDVVKVDWLLRCIDQKRLLPW